MNEDQPDGRYFWLSTFFLCQLITFPYLYDSLFAAYKEQIVEDLGISHTQFGLLFSISAITGMLSGPFSVIMLFYQLSAARCGLMASWVVFFGGFLTTAAFYWENYSVMMVGRCLFWMALFFLMTCQYSMIRRFTQAKIILLYGLSLASCRLGGVAGYYLSGHFLVFFDGLTPQYNSAMMSLTFCTCLLLMTCLFCWVFIRLNPHSLETPMETPLSLSDCAKDFARMSRGFSRNLWLIFASLGCVYGSVFPFEVVGVNILRTEYYLPATISGEYLSICPLPAILAPFLSTIQDDPISQSRYLILGFGTLAVGFLALWLDAWLIGAVVIIGIGYALCTTLLWTLVVDLGLKELPWEPREKVTLVVNSMSFFIFSLFLGFSNVFVGELRDFYSTYGYAKLYFMVLGLYGLLFMLKLHNNLTNQSRTADLRLLCSEEA